jgi:hypothetical protein
MTAGLSGRSKLAVFLCAWALTAGVALAQDADVAAAPAADPPGADACAGRVVAAVTPLNTPLYELSTRQVAAVALNKDLIGRVLLRCDATGLYVLMFAGRELGMAREGVSLSAAPDASPREPTEQDAAEAARRQAEADAAAQKAAAEAEQKRLADNLARQQAAALAQQKAQAEAAARAAAQAEQRRLAQAEEAARRTTASRAAEAAPGASSSAPSDTTPAPAAPRSESGTGAAEPPTRAAVRGSAPGAARTISPGGRQRVTTAVFVELTSLDLRRSRNGGSSVVLLATSPRDFERNIALCRALASQLEAASVGEVIAGERTVGSSTQALRPLYWLLKTSLPRDSADRCADRIARYDFVRAGNIRRKYGLSGRGPYVVVARQDESRAAVVDFGAAPIEETEELVRYFKDSFSQDADIWAPERHGPGAGEQRIAAFLGRSIAGAALTSLVTPIAQAACPLGDPLDVCGQ